MAGQGAKVEVPEGDIYKLRYTWIPHHGFKSRNAIKRTTNTYTYAYNPLEYDTSPYYCNLLYTTLQHYNTTSPPLPSPSHLLTILYTIQYNPPLPSPLTR